MRNLAVLGVAISMLTAGFVMPVKAADGKTKAVITSPCERSSQSKPDQAPPVDLSGSGLIFDPRAPGGAHPEEAGRETIPVDPTAITLFPPSAPQPKSNGGNHKTLIPCRP